jgi:hypothetical protein
MITIIRELLKVEGVVTLVNSQGNAINIVSVATGEIGCYTNRGKYYSRTSLDVLGYRLIK